MAAAQLGPHDHPLISCLMVTQAVPARLESLERSLAAYGRQTYPNRELVIVLDQGTADARAAIRKAVDALGRDDIRIIDPPGPLTLGALRNVSWRAARGDIVCQWDDDDLYHPERLERQLAGLRAADGRSVCLQEVMHYTPATRRMRLTNWRASPQASMPSTLMCLRSAPVCYPETGPEARLGEDLVVHAQLQALGGLHIIEGAPHLYVYVSHGQNTCSDEHHRMIADRLGVSLGLLRRREAAIRAGLAPFDFGPGEVVIESPAGPAFSIPGQPATG
ncbi:MAG: glycosyltransferase family A protein [Caulobacterales bacterium]